MRHSNYLDDSQAKFFYAYSSFHYWNGYWVLLNSIHIKYESSAVNATRQTMIVHNTPWNTNTNGNSVSTVRLSKWDGEIANSSQWRCAKIGMRFLLLVFSFEPNRIEKNIHILLTAKRTVCANYSLSFAGCLWCVYNLFAQFITTGWLPLERSNADDYSAIFPIN